MKRIKKILMWILTAIMAMIIIIPAIPLSYLYAIHLAAKMMAKKLEIE